MNEKKISAEQNVKRKTKIYMLFAGWEGRIVKNCDRGLENAARGLCLNRVVRET